MFASVIDMCKLEENISPLATSDSSSATEQLSKFDGECS